MNACGLDCAECPSFGKECRGCAAEQGKVYWTEHVGAKICPLYACAQKKGMKDCGECGELPCAIWLSLRDPALSEEAFQASLQNRMRRLGR